MVELRLLTEEAKQTRFDFVWGVEDCIGMALLSVCEGEQVLRYAIESALQMHGQLDFGLARPEWRQ
jgi:hypothetical protein